MKRKTLTPGTKLQPYFVRNEIGQDYFGATYLMMDNAEAERRYQVREFFPVSISKRNKGRVLPARKANTEAFETARNRCGEAYTRLEGLGGEGVVNLLDQFEAHNTRYLVASWPEGDTLAEILQEFGTFSVQDLRSLFRTILPNVKRLHDRGVVHGGLSAKSIIRTKTGMAVINMPYAPALLGEVPIIAAPEGAQGEYRAPELSDPEASVTEAADVYSLSAIGYLLLTETIPPSALTRQAAIASGSGDPLNVALLRDAVGEDKQLGDALLAGLALDPAQRPVTLTALQNQISMPLFVSGGQNGRGNHQTWFSHWGKWALAAAWIMIAFVGLYFFLPRDTLTPDNPPVITAGIEAVPENTPKPDKTPQITAPPDAGLDETSDMVSPANVETRDGILPLGETNIPVVPGETPDAEGEPPILPDADLTEEAKAWEKASEADDWRAYRAYLGDHPEGEHAEEAQSRLEVQLTARGDLVEAVRGSFTLMGELVGSGRTMDAALSERIAGFETERGLPLTGDVSEALLSELQKTVAELDIPATSPVPEEGVFRDCDNCPELVALPAGAFLMGSPEGEAGRNSAESLPETVMIENAFAIMSHEVSVGDYASYLAETGVSAGAGCVVSLPETPGFSSQVETARFDAPGSDVSAQHPASCVSLGDAQDYADWLSAKTGKTYRLPTETEWEYAARAGSVTAYFWGDAGREACQKANGADASLPEGWIGNTCNDGGAVAAKTGSYPPNAFGLYDMSGNVWEWTSDCMNDCAIRAVRGGSWASSPDQLRSAKRYSARATSRYNTIGFRLVREM